MSYQRRQALYEQCLSRVLICSQPEKRGETFGVEAVARRAAWAIHRNYHRIPLNMPPNPQTGVPDQYVDEVIKHVIEEGARVEALKRKDGKAWEWALRFLHTRVRSYLFRHGVPVDPTSVEDLVQICALKLWLSLERYPYDSQLEAWLSVFAAREVHNWCRSPGFRWTVSTLSLEELGAGLYASPSGDTIPDERAYQSFRARERWLTIEAGLSRLSPAQRDLVLRQLSGQTTPEIAQAMGCTRNAVYKLRQRAVAELRGFLAAG
ncbi:MAG TPA: RNA polymerase sigma factor [Chloroflexi bacterium]|nr:RNA polymerase sigma factor [Chloroflexota bacterium]